jgi:L-alanine-DL-glutamate epimerase-like enolase superfamily enzyme
VLESDITIPTGTIAHASAAAARAEADGFRRLKIKVGGASVEDDAARVRAAASAAPSCALLLDANASLESAAAIELVARLDGIAIALFEQPVAADDWEGLRDVRHRTRIPIALDESACSASDVLRATTERAVDVVNIKMMKSGVAEALRMVEVARAAGLRLMIGGMVESILAMSASACLAAGVGAFSFVDLDTPLFMLPPRLRGGYIQRGAELDLGAIEAGHGVVPDSTR